MPVDIQGGHKSHLYIFIRNLFTRVLTILLAISHANSNDPSSSASCDRPELKRRARDTINPRRFLLIPRSFARYRSSGHRGTTARRDDDFEIRFPETAIRIAISHHRIVTALAANRKHSRIFRYFSRGTARSRDRAQDTLFPCRPRAGAP